MKDLKSIKIINAADLKNASNIKLAAANLLSQSKLHDLKVEARDYDYEHNGNNCGEKCSFIILVVVFYFMHCDTRTCSTKSDLSES